MTITEWKVRTMAKTHDGNRFGPYVGNEYKLVGMMPNIQRMAQIHANSVQQIGAIILARETCLLILRITK